ncbi:MAG: aminoacetone oxidase family FAD-binding enzyme, partial [Bacteroidales bacterium]|nr:aminoacetone oxidase family FAD-binding enzyme [Bacteroidales bacterium]
MTSDILIIGGGAAGLMAAYGAGSALFRAGKTAQVTVLEKMPRPGRKIMITGKGRCNFTNVKAWNDFSRHIRTNPNVLRPAFYNLTPQALISLFAVNGMRAVVERGDRAFPASYQASDVVDTLVRMAGKVGANLVHDADVESINYQENKKLYHVTCSNGKEYSARVLILATGGLSYPSTGSTGDGYAWAEALGHTLTERFPSLTALVPEGYKNAQTAGTDGPKHIDRSVPMEKMGKYLYGNKLKNCGLRLVIDGNTSEEEFG